MTDIEIGRAAGWLDGEGSILIKREKPRRSGYNSVYCVVVEIGMTCLEVLRILKVDFGGYIYTKKLRPPRRQSWQWVIKAQKAAAFLRIVEPHLVAKRLEARIALVLQEAVDTYTWKGRGRGRGRAPIIPEEIQKRESLYQEMLEARRN